MIIKRKRVICNNQLNQEEFASLVMDLPWKDITKIIVEPEYITIYSVEVKDDGF